MKTFVEEPNSCTAEEAQALQSDLINRVRAFLERKDLRMLAESCSDIKKLTCLDLKNRTFAQDRRQIEE